MYDAHISFIIADRSAPKQQVAATPTIIIVNAFLMLFLSSTRTFFDIIRIRFEITAHEKKNPIYTHSGIGRLSMCAPIICRIKRPAAQYHHYVVAFVIFMHICLPCIFSVYFFRFILFLRSSESLE